MTESLAISTFISSARTSWLERVTAYLLMAALLTVSFSTALVNIFAGLACIVFIFALFNNKPLQAAVRQPPALLALGLLLFYIVGISWSIAPWNDIDQALHKYAKLLVMPIAIALSLRMPALPRRALQCFMAGAVVLAASCYLVWFQKMPTTQLNWWRVGDAQDAFAFKNHITIGILLGFAALVCFLKASHGKHWRACLPGLAGGILFTIPIIFLGQGRTGYVVLMVGLFSLLLLRLRMTILSVLAGAAAVGVLFGAFYLTSANFKLRTDQFIAEVRGEHVDNTSPNGIRLSFFRAGTQMILEHPVLGQGTASFAEAYAPTAKKLWPADSPMATVRNQPHSEFMLVTVQLGVVGWLVYMTMLLSVARPSMRVRSFETDCLAMLSIIYVSTSAFNSLLWDPTEGYWFMLLAGCLYVRCLDAGKRLALTPAGQN